MEKENKTKTINVYTNIDQEYPLSHDYDIDISSETVTLKRSAHNIWTIPGEEVLVCKDDRDHYEITLSDNKKIKLDYGAALELYILLGILNEKDKIEYRESTVIKSI